jgi:O-antigen ligase
MTSSLPFAIATNATRSRRSSNALLDNVLFYGVFGLLLFAPLAFGAVETWSISVVQAATGAFFALWAVRQVATGELEIIGNPLFIPILVFGGLTLGQLASGRTAYRFDTSSAAMQYWAYSLLCFLVVQCLRRTAQIRILAWIVSSYGFAVAMFALLQGLASNGKLYWLRNAESGGWIYGPYVNHNHYAGLMELLMPIPLVVALAGSVSGTRRGLAAMTAALMASTIFLAGSRGGMAAFAVQIVLLAAFVIRRRKNWKTVFAFCTFLVIALGLLMWLGGGELVDRLASIHSGARTELSGGTRLTIDRDALKMFAEKPVLGWGLGVFPDVFPQFSSLATNLQVGMAHNDYLQLLVEMGALGFAVALWFLVTLFRTALNKLKTQPADTNTAVTLAALLGVSGILVHSFVDFNLQIPANAALFYVLCVVAAGEPHFGLHRRKRRNPSHLVEGLSTEPVSTTASIG